MTLTLADELDRAAAERPHGIFLRMDGEDVTYLDCSARVLRRARQLWAVGLRSGQAVALLMDNSIEQVVTWFALSRLGAVHAPINPALAGAMLEHTFTTADPVLVIVDDAYWRAAETASGGMRRVLTATEIARLPYDVAVEVEVAAIVCSDIDTATLLFTSGTTGPAKACALSHRYLVRGGQLHARALGLTQDDVLFCPFPLFHIDAATLTVSAALAVRGTAALARRFSASGFWPEVRRTGATVFNFMGATLAILWKREPSPEDCTHGVRLAWGVPMPQWQQGFEKRFGFPLYQLYGSTDAGISAYDPIDARRRPGRAGRVLPEYEVRIDTTRRRPGDRAGVGEILIRGREPGLVMNGYYRDEEATANTIRDGWVRTGDLGELDDDGYLAFHGRLSDSLRRRGENISAFEVEELVASHPDVLEVAALGVPSDLTEEEVLVCVVRHPGATVTAPQIRAHCLDHGPAFMAPRYVRFVDELPKTPTQKTEKFRLRQDGITTDTWDADL